jgi:hypothetical protein
MFPQKGRQYGSLHAGENVPWGALFAAMTCTETVAIQNVPVTGLPPEEEVKLSGMFVSDFLREVCPGSLKHHLVASLFCTSRLA